MVQGHQVRAPGPGHSAKDLVVKLSSTAADGFVVYSHAGDDALACKDHVRERSGLAPFKARGKRRAAHRSAADHRGDIGDLGERLGEARVKAGLRIWEEAEPLRSPGIEQAEHFHARLAVPHGTSPAAHWAP